MNKENLNKENLLEKLSKRKRRKIANNTYASLREDGTIEVKLHQTNVIVFNPDDSITLDNGGWQTVTTKDRIGYAVGICQRNYTWYIEWHGKTYEFENNMRLHANGMVTRNNVSLNPFILNINIQNIIQPLYQKEKVK